MEGTNMSPADFSALMGNNNGFGGNSWWIILLFLFMMNGNGNWGNRYTNDAMTQEVLFGQKFQGLDNKIDRIGNGIADATFALNNTIHTAQDTVAGAVVSEGRGLQQNIADLRLGEQKNACDIVSAIHADGEATRALIRQNEVQALRDKVAALEADNRMCGVVRYPMSYAYSAGPSPFCNCGCGCGNNNI